MASANISISPELLRGKASDVRAIRGQHDEAMSKLDALILNLEEVYSSESQKAFVERYQGMKTTFTQFSELLEKYASDLDLAAKSFEDLDMGLAAQNRQ